MRTLASLTTLIALGTPCFLVTTAYAQSPAPQGPTLEQTYASLCAGKPGAESEACAALKSALVAKLTSKPVTASAPMEGVAKLSQADIRKRWGVYADVAGKRYFNRVGEMYFITTLTWQKLGEELVMHIGEATKRGEYGGNRTTYRTVYQWDDARQGIVTKGSDASMKPEADGSFLTLNPDGKHRSRVFSKVDGSWVITVEELKGGAWQPIDYGYYHYIEMTPQFVASLQPPEPKDGGLLGGLGRIVEGAAAGAAGMVSGGGGYDAAIAGAAAGAVAGAAGVEASSINQGFREGSADVNARNAEMEAQMARSSGQRGPLASNSAANGTVSAPAKVAIGNATGGDVLRKRSVNAYFWVSTVPSGDDDHNTHCASNVFPITIDWNDQGWGNGERAAAVLDPMMSTFLDKCQRLKPITSPGDASYSVEGVTSYGSVTFRKGDTQVRMP